MTLEPNDNFLNPFGIVYPVYGLGEAMGEAQKATCATCHSGVHKPLFGAPMARDFPELMRPAATGAMERRSAQSAPSSVFAE